MRSKCRRRLPPGEATRDYDRAVSSRAAAITGGVSAWLVRAMLIVAAAFLLWWGQNAFTDYERAATTTFEPEFRAVPE